MNIFYLDAAEQVLLPGRSVFSLYEAEHRRPSRLKTENVTSASSLDLQESSGIFSTFSFLLRAWSQLHFVSADNRSTVTPGPWLWSLRTAWTVWTPTYSWTGRCRGRRRGRRTAGRRRGAAGRSETSAGFLLPVARKQEAERMKLRLAAFTHLRQEAHLRSGVVLVRLFFLQEMTSLLSQEVTKPTFC